MKTEQNGMRTKLESGGLETQVKKTGQNSLSEIRNTFE